MNRIISLMSGLLMYNTPQMTERTGEQNIQELVAVRSVQEVFGRRYMTPEAIAALDVAVNYERNVGDPGSHNSMVNQGHIVQTNILWPFKNASGRSKVPDRLFFNWWNLTFPDPAERGRLERVLKGSGDVKDRISLKELSYAWLTARGLKDAEIAEALNLTEDGVDNHGTRIRKIIENRTGNSPCSKVDTALGCVQIGAISNSFLQRTVPLETRMRLREVYQKIRLGEKVLKQEEALDAVTSYGSYSNTAKILGDPVGTIKTRLHAIKAKMDGIDTPIHLLVAYKLMRNMVDYSKAEAMEK